MTMALVALIGVMVGAIIVIATLVAEYDKVSRALEQIVKPGEEVACRNATVLIDAQGEISWIDNDRLPEIIQKDKED